MKRQILFLALATTALMLGTSSKAQAWGACHVGYTHYGAGGFEHYGATAARGPYGSYSGSHASAYGASGGAYHEGGYSSESRYGGYSSGGYHSYSGGYSGGYAAGGYHYGSSSYSAGAYRAW